MKPAYTALKTNHYSANKNNATFVDKTDVYKEIGYDYDNLVKENPGYSNTCAVRMSLALLKSGVSFSGRLKIKTGKYTGKLIEPGAKLLADKLSLGTAFGKPKIFKPSEFESKIGRYKGVIFFWKISGYGGGHIDLIESVNASQVCHSACFPLCSEVWFWSLP